MYETRDASDGLDPSSTARALIDDAVHSLIENPNYAATLVQNAHRHSLRDGKPTLVAISVGDSINDEAQLAAEETIDAPSNAPLHRSAIEILHHAPTGADFPKLFAHYQAEIQSALARPENQEKLRANQAELTRIVKRARGDGVLVFFAAGNSHQVGLPSPPGTAKDTAAVPGMIVVGATDARRGELAAWSGEGANIALPGTDVPVGPAARSGTASIVEGSSFSGPDGAALAALMVKAGIDDVDEIERILTSPMTSHPVGGSSVNATIAPDEIAAVVAASAHGH
jgi:hypothetical protein